MRGTVRIAKLFGIPVEVHWSFGLILLIIIYTGINEGMTLQGLLWFGFIFMTLFVCVIMHEFGHALSARRFGIHTKDIILFPIGGVARLQNLPENPKHELIIAIAGPVVNFSICLVLGTYLFVTSLPIPFPPQDPLELYTSPAYYVPAIILLNLMLGIFNLVPAFPMDGGRVLRSLFSMKWGHLRATFWATRVGQVLAFGFVGFSIWSGSFMLGFIGVFVFFAARWEYRMVKYQERKEENVRMGGWEDAMNLAPQSISRQGSHINGKMEGMEKLDEIS